jgi:hypothetical protein
MESTSHLDCPHRPAGGLRNSTVAPQHLRGTTEAQEQFLMRSTVPCITASCAPAHNPWCDGPAGQLLPSLLLQPCICLCTAAGAPGAGTHCCACQLLQPHACALIRLHRPACSSMQQVHTAALTAHAATRASPCCDPPWCITGGAMVHIGRANWRRALGTALRAGPKRHLAVHTCMCW